MSWQVVGSRWIFNDRWYRLLAEQVNLGDGTTIDYYLGVFPDIVLVLAITPEEDAMLVRQYKHGAQQVLIELPAGYVDDGEAPLAAAQRELREETGYAGEQWRALGSYLGNPTKERGGTLHYFLLTDARQICAPQPDATEAIEVLQVPVAELYSASFLASIAVGSSRLGLELARGELATPSIKAT